MPNSPEHPSTPLDRKGTDTLVQRTPDKLTPAPRTISTAICARAVPASSPTSIYSTSSTIQREGAGGVEEDNQGGRIKGPGGFGSVATARVRG